MARWWTRWRRLWGAMLTAAALCAAVAAPALAAGPMGIDPGDVVDSSGNVTMTPAVAQSIAAAGAGWARVEFNTGPFGGTDSPAFYAAYDQVVDNLLAQGVQVLGLVDYETEPGTQSDWTANNQENTGGNGDNDYIVGLGAITARIVNHYQGKIQYYEVWNEPNCFGSSPSPGVYVGCTYIYPSNFAALLTEVYAQSKIYNHYNVDFVSGGLFGHSIGGVYNCGNAGADYLTATYNEGINITDKFTWAKNNDGGNYPLDAIGQHIYINQGGTVTTAQMQQYLGCIRNAYTAYDSGSKKIWVTEFGWNTSNVSEATQAANIDTAFSAFQNTSYVQTATLFDLDGFSGGNDWGIYETGCGLTPSCEKTSYSHFLNDTTYQGKYSNGTTDAGILDYYNGHGGQATWGSPFDNGGGPWVHTWDVGVVQDVSGGSAGAAMIMDGPGGTHSVTAGFRQALFGSLGQCHYPLDDAYGWGGGTRQDFQGCDMTWTSSGGVVVHPYLAAQFNNTGISDDSAPGGANYDGGGYSYSQQALTAAGLAPGKAVTAGGLGFQWPSAASGTADNVQVSGQTIALPPSPVGASSLGFLGSATNSPSSGTSGTATVTYTDGTTAQVTLCFSDWTLDGNKYQPACGNTEVASMSYRNGSGGKQSVPAYVFLDTVPINPAKAVASVILPSSTSQGQLHVFAVSGVYNNIGISADGSGSTANFDTVGYSYSQQALNGAGLAPGVSVTAGGLDFTWPLVGPGTPDNTQAAGQTIAVSAPSGATTLGFLGSATNGPSSGTATIHYSDQSTQQVTLCFSDWTLDGGSAQPTCGNTEVATMSYRNGSSGQQNVSTYVFYTSVALQSGKTVVSVTLPSSVNQGQLHVFAVAAG